MKKEEFIALGISEELAAKAEAASQKELEGYAAKEQLDTANAENKTLKQSVADRDKQLEELRKSSGDNADLKKQIEELQKAQGARRGYGRGSVRPVEAGPGRGRQGGRAGGAAEVHQGGERVLVQGGRPRPGIRSCRRRKRRDGEPFRQGHVQPDGAGEDASGEPGAGQGAGSGGRGEALRKKKEKER